jgi:putative endonuclease
MAPLSHYPDIGTLGEDFVAEWLSAQDWKILHRRWQRSRRGEIDIIAEHQAINENKNIIDLTLAFIEVKTRSAFNWDSGGRDAILVRKQQKLWRAAQMFLAEHPEKADYTCRFDVAIVFCEQKSKRSNNLTANGNLCSQALQENLGYHLTLQEYIAGAFDSLDV